MYIIFYISIQLLKHGEEGKMGSGQESKWVRR